MSNISYDFDFACVMASECSIYITHLARGIIIVCVNYKQRHMLQIWINIYCNMYNVLFLYKLSQYIPIGELGEGATLQNIYFKHYG